MSSAQPKSSGIVTLMSDFGTADSYVGAMKGVILTFAPAARLVDLSHEVPPQRIDLGAHVLAEAAPYFPDGTVHLAVVDPGVGSARRAIAVSTDRAFLVGPDNGVLSLAIHALGGASFIHEIANPQFHLPNPSSTFHGRDIFAPAAAHLARGGHIADLGNPMHGMSPLEEEEAVQREGEIEGRVVYVDRFGNLLTNIASADVGPDASAALGPIDVGPIATSYASVPEGHPVALFSSNGRVEIAVRNGSAAARFGNSAVVTVRW